MEHCSYRHSYFYDLIPLLMSSIESHLSNKSKQVFFLTQYIYLILLHTLLHYYTFLNILFSFNVNFFNLQYQKAYLEFFTTRDNFTKLKDLIEDPNNEQQGKYKSLTYHATNYDGSITLSNNPTGGTAAVTWGVFPGREVLQPTVVDPEAFMVSIQSEGERASRIWKAL